MDWLVAEFKKDQGIDVSKDKMVIQRLREAAEKAKIELSSVSETEINLPFLTADASGPKHMQIKLSRAKLEQMMGDLVQRTIEPTKKALADASKKPADIAEVVLVGGSTRIPMVQKLVKEFFGKEPHKGVNPDEVVALGAAVQAGVLVGRRQGHAAPRRHAAVARHRDAGRRDDHADPAQHDHPDQEERDLLDGGRQPELGRGQGVPGRAADGGRQPPARQVRARRDSAGAARRAADRGHLRHRRQRHRQRVGQGQGDRARRSTSPSPRRRACPRPRSSAW